MRFFKRYKLEDKEIEQQGRMPRAEIESELVFRARDYVFAGDNEEQRKITRRAYDFIYDNALPYKVPQYIIYFNYSIVEAKRKLLESSSNYPNSLFERRNRLE